MGPMLVRESSRRPARGPDMTGISRANPKAYISKTIRSPVGVLTLIGSNNGLAAILWENDRPGRVRLEVVGEDARHPVLRETERQLAEYFAGRRKVFDLKLDFAGTEFQKKVW